MTPIVSTFEVARPPHEVYAYLTDPTRFPEWQPDVARVRVEAGRPAGVGSRFATTRRIGRIEHTTTQEVTRSDPPHGWAARGVDGPFRPGATVTVEPIDGGGSRVTVALEFEGSGIGRLLPLEVIGRMAARSAPRSYQNLRRLLERDT
ncbi:SRPBCC family protein [Rugosimonospora africana]|uniref:Polyketide cyclase / dehydrase and lipid transport n=1 Tax=Rugosimonospora africana TaxID=556532 RepID=A0A8J3QVW4_9ACTN|nr:SRPBCC family protein [Rugosimonospora africana]GIH15726.1 hypothetical protein Raf01_38980 [Rugosimonospora africana]